MNYWIIHLRLSTLLEILKREKWKNISRITYIQTTLIAKIFIKLTKKLKIFPDIFDRVEPRDRPSGPMLNLSQVRNDKGEVIINDIFLHILEIRRYLYTQIVDSFQQFDIVKKIKAKNMMTACLGMKIAREITPTVYMAHFIRWKEKRHESKRDKKNILIIPKSDWSDYLKSNFRLQVDEVWVDRKHKALRQTIKVILHMTKLIPTYIICKIPKSLRGYERKTIEGLSDDHNLKKIVVVCNLGVLKDHRNDLEFFHSAPIEPERILIFLKSDQILQSQEEMTWMRQNGIHCYSGSQTKGALLDIPEWKSSQIFKQELLDFYGDYLKTAAKSIFKRKNHSLWLLVTLWKMGREMAYWKDFFISNDIGLIIHSVPLEESFIRNLALSEIGGIAVYRDRSILFDFFTYIHNSPNHIHFVSGPYSQKQFPEPSFSLFTLQSGGLNINPLKDNIEGIEPLREGSRILISVFDETPNDWFFGDSVQQMYQALIDLIDEDDRFALLVKTKKPHVLKRLPEINKELERLRRDGKCVKADWKTRVSTASACSDLTVCVPSTAAFESVLAGKKTIVYNPMRAGSSIFYRNQGLNKRIFEDTDSMISAIKMYANNKDDKIGDFSDFISEIDPFHDGLGAERVGQYIKACLDGFDQGLNREEILDMANELYVSRWGKDKVIGENRTL